MLRQACRRGCALLTVGLVVAGLAAGGTAGADSPAAGRYKPPGPPYVQRADHSICTLVNGRASGCTWFFHLDINFNGETSWRYSHEQTQPNCDGEALYEGHGTDQLHAHVTLPASYWKSAAKQFLIYAGAKQLLRELRNGVYVEHDSQYPEGDCHAPDKHADTRQCGKPAKVFYFLLGGRMPGMPNGRGRVTLGTERLGTDYGIDFGCPAPNTIWGDGATGGRQQDNVPHHLVLSGDFPVAGTSFESSRLTRANPGSIHAAADENFVTAPNWPAPGPITVRSHTDWTIRFVPCKLDMHQKPGGAWVTNNPDCGGKPW